MSEKSANIEEGYDSMPELIPDYDNLEDDDLKVGDFFREFLDGKGDKLVKDLGGDAFMRTFMCAMLANAGRVAEGVKTELYDSGASHHMTASHDQLENFVSIGLKSIVTADSKLQARGICTLKFQMAK